MEFLLIFVIVAVMVGILFAVVAALSLVFEYLDDNHGIGWAMVFLVIALSLGATLIIYDDVISDQTAVEQQ